MCAILCTVTSLTLYVWPSACQAPISVSSPGKNSGVDLTYSLKVVTSRRLNLRLLCLLHGRRIFHCATLWDEFIIHLANKEDASSAKVAQSPLVLLCSGISPPCHPASTAVTPVLHCEANWLPPSPSRERCSPIPRA